jgi:hypothetical protein
MKYQVFLAVMTMVLCDYQIYRHSIESGARCLDGSPSAIYISKGSNPSKILIYFQ